MKLLPAVLTALLALPCAVQAQTSKEFARMGRTTWSAFTCSALSSMASDPKETERLFQTGYDNGKKFFAALEAKKIQPADLNTELPFIMTTLMAGPTKDFVLGRIYEVALDTASKTVLNPDKAIQKLAAQSKYDSQNCSLVR